MNRLDFDAFNTEQQITPENWLGQGIRMAFDPECGLKVNAACEVWKNRTSLMIRSDNRDVAGWMGLEIDVPDSCKSLSVTCRYAPTERIFPRVYYKHHGKAGQIDEPDRSAPTGAERLIFETARWKELAHADELTDQRLALLLPTRPWFALQLFDVSEQQNA